MSTEQTEQQIAEQERAEETRREERYKIEGQIARHLERLAMALEGLGDTKDKSEQGAYALLARKEYVAARALVLVHKAMGGSYYSVNFTPFNDLYRN